MKRFLFLLCNLMTFMYLFAGVRASDFRDSDDSLSMGFLIFIGVICLLLLVVIIYADIMNKNKK